MIEFAQLHVEEFRKQVIEKVKKNVKPNCSDHTPFWGSCVTCGRTDNPRAAADNHYLAETIEEMYPLTNIK
jgi:hypothetical protein